MVALLVGGGFLVQFLRKNNIGDEDEDEDDFDDYEDEDGDVEYQTSTPNETTGRGGGGASAPTLGVPCFNWSGQDNGCKMKSEI